MPNPIEELRNTRWWRPAVRRYKAHLDAVTALECPALREKFVKFAEEVLSTPEQYRDSLLDLAPPDAYEAHRSYGAYISPIPAKRT